MIFLANAASAWFTIRVQILGAIILLFICIFAFSGSLGPSLVGLCISYGLAISDELMFSVMILSWLENSMVCPERILQYCHIPREGTVEQKRAYKLHQGIDEVSQGVDEIEMSPLHAPTASDNYDSNWIKQGKLCFDHVYFRYQPRGDCVLSDLDFTINAGEKIGIVGRTGSGKSSLSMSLFRIAELSSGRVRLNTRDWRLEGRIFIPFYHHV